jgi:hypothetical protein
MTVPPESIYGLKADGSPQDDVRPAASLPTVSQPLPVAPPVWVAPREMPLDAPAPLSAGPGAVGDLPTDPRAAWRKVRLGLLLLVCWSGLLVGVVLKGLPGNVTGTPLAFDLVVQLVLLVPIGGYTLCLFAPFPAPARHLALANLGAVALSLAVMLSARYVERVAERKAEALATGGKAADDEVRAVKDRAGTWQRVAALALGILGGVQNTLLAAYLHVLGRALAARQLAEGAARAAMLALACTLLLLFTGPFLLLAPTGVGLGVLLAGFLAVVSVVWQTILLVQACRVLGWQLATAEE